MKMDEGFLRSVVEAPEEAPRLIYADWLEENGQSERAEFIRVQCQLATLSEEDQRRPALQAREAALLAEHGAAWAKPFHKFTKRLQFGRGFVQRVALPATKFLQLGEKLFASMPILELRLLQAPAAIDQLATSPLLGRLRELDLHANNLGVARVRALLSNPHLIGLRKLNLAYTQLRMGGVDALADCPHLTSLTELHINLNHLPDAALVVLAEAPLLTQLESLALGYNDFTGTGLEVLLGTPAVKGLRRLDLSRSFGQGDAFARAVAACPHLTGLRRLDLWDTSLSDAGLRALADSPYLGGLRELNLSHSDYSGNVFTERGLRALIASDHLPRHLVLDLSSGIRETPDVLSALRDRFGRWPITAPWPPPE